MIHVALIVLDENCPEGRILGLGWPEYRIRAAVRLGAARVVILANRIGVDLLGAIDRAKADGVVATIVRHVADVGDLIHPDETVLLMAGSAVVDELALAQLVNEAGLAVLGMASSDARLELIDSQHRWLGFARLNGTLVRGLTKAAPDWDPASLLMREAVSSGARRVTIPPEAKTVFGSDAGADRAIVRLALASLPSEAAGWVTRWLVEPVSRWVALLIPHRLPIIARHGFVAALLLFGTSAALAARGLFVAACLVTLVGIEIGAIARKGAMLTGIRAIGHARFQVVRTISAAVTVFLIAVAYGVDHAIPLLALVLFAVIALGMALPIDGPSAIWRSDVPGVLLILAATSPFGASGVLIGVSLCVFHSFVSLYWLQNRLSRALTPPR